MKITSRPPEPIGISRSPSATTTQKSTRVSATAPEPVDTSSINSKQAPAVLPTADTAARSLSPGEERDARMFGPKSALAVEDWLKDNVLRPFSRASTPEKFLRATRDLTELNRQTVTARVFWSGRLVAGTADDRALAAERMPLLDAAHRGLGAAIALVLAPPSGATTTAMSFNKNKGGPGGDRMGPSDPGSAFGQGTPGFGGNLGSGAGISIGGTFGKKSGTDVDTLSIGGKVWGPGLPGGGGGGSIKVIDNSGEESGATTSPTTVGDVGDIWGEYHEVMSDLDSAAASGDAEALGKAIDAAASFIDAQLAGAGKAAAGAEKDLGVTADSSWGTWGAQDDVDVGGVKGAMGGGGTEGSGDVHNENQGGDVHKDKPDDVPAEEAQKEDQTPIEDPDKPAPGSAGVGLPDGGGGDPFVSEGGGDEGGDSSQPGGKKGKGKGKGKGGDGDGGQGFHADNVKVGGLAPQDGWGDGKGPGGPRMNPVGKTK